MGLDMYLNSRRKLNDAEKEAISVARKLADEHDEIVQEIYLKALTNIGSTRVKQYNENKEGEKEINNYDELPFPIKLEVQNASRDFIDKIDEVKTAKEKVQAQNEIINKILDRKDLGYWRKHADLNEFMTQLYYDRGGQEEFNCVELILSKEDCEMIRDKAQAIIDGKETVTKGEGFFWGETLEGDWEDTVEIFQKALDTVDFDDEEVVYHCWY